MKIGLAISLKPVDVPSTGGPIDQFEEFDSPQTAEAITAVLEKLGHTVIVLGDGRELVERLLRDAPDFVFNIAEGAGTSRNRESRVPAICEMLGIPYSGSDPLTLGLALDKDLARRTVESAEVQIPAGLLISFAEEYDGDFAEFPAIVEEGGLSLPLIAKPVWEGSSKGIHNKCVIRTAEELGPVIVALARDYRQPVLLEEFIIGDEVTIGIMGNDPPTIIGVMRIVPKQANEHFVYSLEVKRDYENHVTYESPAQLPLAVLQALETAALSAYDSLGCRDICRLDFRVRDGVPYFIEANPLPGLNPITSDFMILASGTGNSYEEIIGRILSEAMARHSA